jgi:hypothetical protein
MFLLSSFVVHLFTVPLLVVHLFVVPLFILPLLSDILSINQVCPTLTRAYVIPHHTRVVMFPGYGCVSQDYKQLENYCRKHDVPYDCVPIKRYEWLNVFSSVGSIDYLNYRCTPDQLFGWYLNKASITIQDSLRKNNGNPVVLCGHSAGGWLARAVMQNNTLYGADKIQTNDAISSLITLGTPHEALPLDITHGCLNYINKHYSLIENIRYTTVGSMAKKVELRDHYSLEDQFVLNSYRTVVDSFEQDYIYGDGIVPTQVSHLKGARNINFDDVYHFKKCGKKWYFDESIMDVWFPFL